VSDTQNSAHDLLESLPPSNGSTADNFDFDAMTLPQSFDDLVAVKEVLTQVPVRKARKDEYFRIHPDPVYAQDYLMVKRDETLHPIMPTLVHLVPEENVKRYKLYTAVTSKGRVFLFPAEQPNKMGELHTVARNYHVICRAAREQWTRMWWDDSERIHKTQHLDHDRAPVFPDKEYKELVKLAFGDIMITTPDHPVIRYFKGEDIF
jgi:hypothetical protein